MENYNDLMCVIAALCHVVYTDTDPGHPVVQQAPQHHPGCGAGAGERRDGRGETTAQSSPPGADLGSG